MYKEKRLSHSLSRSFPKYLRYTASNWFPVLYITSAICISIYTWRQCLCSCATHHHAYNMDIHLAGCKAQRCVSKARDRLCVYMKCLEWVHLFKHMQSKINVHLNVCGRKRNVCVNKCVSTGSGWTPSYRFQTENVRLKKSNGVLKAKKDCIYSEDNSEGRKRKKCFYLSLCAHV